MGGAIIVAVVLILPAFLVYGMIWVGGSYERESEKRLEHFRALGDMPFIHEEMKAATRKTGGGGASSGEQRPNAHGTSLTHSGNVSNR